MRMLSISGAENNCINCRVIPSIEKLMRENLNVGLAISLNSFNNEQRSELMPINKKYPIESLVSIAGHTTIKTEKSYV